MPEIRECFIHYKHAHYVLVEQLGLGQDNGPNWTLQNLFADSTDEEAKVFNKKPSGTAFGLTSKHGQGYIDQIGPTCTLVRGQKSNQTRIWPETAESESLETLDNLVLSGLSHTPRSLILNFGKLDLQV